jgi:hypothetical protein
MPISVVKGGDIWPSTDWAVLAALAHCADGLRLLEIDIPMSFSVIYTHFTAWSMSLMNDRKQQGFQQANIFQY